MNHKRGQQARPKATTQGLSTNYSDFAAKCLRRTTGVGAGGSLGITLSYLRGAAGKGRAQL
jgi:hypothetical protein